MSQEGSILGEERLLWFAAELARTPKDKPLVLFTHRPLFALYPDWDWTTTNGQRALDLLKEPHFVTVFCGHIHQEHHHATGLPPCTLAAHTRRLAEAWPLGLEITAEGSPGADPKGLVIVAWQATPGPPQLALP